jgi:hypothetical protein
LEPPGRACQWLAGPVARPARAPPDWRPARFEQARRARQARQASRPLARANSEAKNSALKAMAEALTRSEKEILAENAKDVAAGKSKGLSAAMLDRLLHHVQTVIIEGTSFRMKDQIQS